MSRKLLVALALLFGFTFVPRLGPAAIAQEEGGDEGDDSGPKLTDAQKKEAQEIGKLEKEANDTIEGKNYAEGAKAFKALCDKIDASTIPADLLKGAGANAHYNYACCLSRTGAKDDAVKEFQKSMNLGFIDWLHIDTDDDLDAIREMDSFKKVVADGKKAEIDALVAQLKKDCPAQLKLKAKSTDGKKLNLATYTGKVLVVVFLLQGEDAQNTIQVINKAAKKLKDKGIEFLALVPGEADEDQLAQVTEELKIKLPLATTKVSDNVKDTIKKGGAVCIIDATGKTRAVARGVFQIEAVDAVTAPLVAEAGSADKKPAGDDKKDGGDDKKPAQPEKKDGLKGEDF
jgi:hypothetical protein